MTTRKLITVAVQKKKAEHASTNSFFSALPPALRPKVAASHAKVIKRGGKLFTVVYRLKVDGDGYDGSGPPVSARLQTRVD